MESLLPLVTNEGGEKDQHSSKKTMLFFSFF